MKIIVFIKQVPDTATKIVLAPDGKSLDETNVNFVINPYDEFALEEALQIKDRDPLTQVTVISLGVERAQNALRSALAMGADGAVLLKDEALLGSDAGATARVLVAALKDVSFDLLLFGKQGVGLDQGQVDIRVAEALGLPHAGVVVKLEIDGGRAVAEREIEGAHEIMNFALPAVVTAQKGLNEPRYASLKGIMAAKKKPIEIRDCAALGLRADQVGESGSLTRIKKLSLPPARKEGHKIEGDPASQAKELIRLLREEAKAL
ncbi:MAG: electron transfer flavoprotein subunit beta/FixA family protein [Acidobacteria bacterium]|nr:electron transfer flavoprotein subunit beta/FixA family protein [Acidobacteriota bacterium]